MRAPPAWGKVLAAPRAVAMASGVVISYQDPALYRHGGAAWSDGIHESRAQCIARPRFAFVGVPIMPEGWVVRVRCSRLG